MGGANLIELAKSFGGLGSMLRAPVSALRAAGLRDESISALKNPDSDLLESDMAWLAEPGHGLLTHEDERYPALLQSISSPPAALFVDGDPDVLWQPQIAIIGSRNPTAGGIDNTRDFAAELSRQGMTVTSGLASGIDSIAHEAALDAGSQTIAVLGTGVDTVYPRGSEVLAGRIREKGALVSEFPPGTAPRRSHFPSRNRIISGLALGVLVIEAGLRSGTLITARLAGNQGREIFALPGSIHNPMAKGCHRLIRDGAKLVENVAEIMQELAPLAGRLADDLSDRLGSGEGDSDHDELEIEDRGPQLELDSEYRQLLSCIGFDPKPIETVIEQSGLTARAVSAMLLMLELRGMVEVHPGRAYSLKKRGK